MSFVPTYYIILPKPQNLQTMAHSDATYLKICMKTFVLIERGLICIQLGDLGTFVGTL